MSRRMFSVICARKKEVFCASLCAQERKGWDVHLRYACYVHEWMSALRRRDNRNAVRTRCSRTEEKESMSHVLRSLLIDIRDSNRKRVKSKGGGTQREVHARRSANKEGCSWWIAEKRKVKGIVTVVSLSVISWCHAIFNIDGCSLTFSAMLDARFLIQWPRFSGLPV